tara:strand:+ start:899 stop:1162 length:264 start_codon:yes stop_codon:yes gene_type:complete
MTRLQNAKKQLNEAMVALESAATMAIKVSHEASAPANPSQVVAGADLSALVDEVSIIEAKLSEAVAMIASVDPRTVGSGKANVGDTQ